MRDVIKFFEKYKKLIVSIILFILLITIGGPIFIHLLFKLSAPNEFFVAEWDAGAFLGYYGTVLTFLSTTILSVLALWQNHIIQKTNDRHTNLLERMEREKNAPYFTIENIIHLGSASNIKFTLKNVSQNIAYNIELLDIAISNHKDETIWSTNQSYKKDYLDYTNNLVVQLYNPAIEKSDQYFIFQLKFTDKFNESHTYKVVGHIMEGSTTPYFEFKEKTI